MIAAFLFLFLTISTGGSMHALTTDFAEACYLGALPSLGPSNSIRLTPWGSPTIMNETTTCCSSLDEVRAGIDSIDAQLLNLLAQRAAYVREATRFKTTRDVVDVPTRDTQVIDGAVQNALAFHLPQTVAKAVFTAIINSSVSFELCVFDSYPDT
ncbi:chorismate mutase [Crepidotus variabilis]|uniref:Chorismate mutase n=1 Tax=Crepidotus variabilis TaxID=179855 RepID=A0A9P6EJ36_9AGAR|nr:chorismate mutase [Crepidotus variabilis]